MNKSLRKGSTTIEFQYMKNTYESINTIETSALIDKGKLTIFTKLNPLDKYDADMVFDQPDSIKKIIFNDKRIKERLASFIKSFKKRNEEIRSIELHILYKKLYTFNISFKELEEPKLELVVNI